MADLQMMVQGFSVSIGSRLLPVLLPLIQSFVQWAVSVLPRVQTALSDVGQFVSNLAQQAQTGKGVFGVLQTSISSVISWVVANLPQISATIQNVLAGISVVVNTIIVPIVNFVISQFEKVISWVVANWPLISQTFTTVLNAIKSVFDAVIPVLAPLVEGAFTSIKAIVETVINIVLGVIKTAMQILNGDWAGAWQTVQQTVIGIFEGINQFFGGIPAKLLEFGKQMIDGLVLGILSNGDKVIKALRGLIDQAIADVKKILGLGGGNASPAYQAGANVAQNINAGYAAALKPLAAPAFARANTPAYGVGRGLGAGGSAQDASASKQIVIPIYLGGREVERYIVDVVKQTVERERGRYG
jgi:phage-related protein